MGTAAGRHSAKVGAYYAHPGNRFWRTLHEVGLTPRLYQPHEYRLLLDLGIGFTDVAKRAAGMDHQIAAEAFDPTGFAAKVELFRPRIVAFTGKRAASYWLGMRTQKIPFGRRQPSSATAPVAYVLPSPSGLAARFWSAEPWQALAAELASVTAN